jgi:hypothetical protein
MPTPFASSALGSRLRPSCRSRRCTSSSGRRSAFSSYPSQAAALRAALALAPADGVDRFRSTRPRSASPRPPEQPLLCVVDDAHWLDDASAEALVFAARRIGDEAVLMLFAAEIRRGRRLPPPASPAPNRRLKPDGRNDPGDCCADAAAPNGEHVIDVSRGNPLALEFGVAAAEADQATPLIRFRRQASNGASSSVRRVCRRMRSGRCCWQPREIGPSRRRSGPRSKRSTSPRTPFRGAS